MELSNDRRGINMVRDNIKDEIYFNKCLAETERSIDKFEELLSKVLNKGENDRGVKSGYIILINKYIAEINLMYSKGEKIFSIRDKYIKLVSLYSKMWCRDYGYIELIRILSLAVLLDIKENEISSLFDKIQEDGFDDYLSNYLILYIKSDWNFESKMFVFSGIYDQLKIIIEETNKSKSLLLENYLTQSWYSNHHDAAWFDSHKSKEDVYYGYWSFEAGAIAKILNIDDSSLKDVPYYPYDLVHYGND